MIGPALAVAAATLAAGIGLALLARRIPSLRGRVVALALVAVVLPLAAVVASGVLMFDSGHDLTVLAAASASATAALVGALLVARSVLEPVARVRRASEALASGDLTARAPESGPAELAELGATFNRMAGELERLFEARRELVAHASHDLRTPLASLQAMLEAVEDGLAPPSSTSRPWETRCATSPAWSMTSSSSRASTGDSSPWSCATCVSIALWTGACAGSPRAPRRGA